MGELAKDLSEALADRYTIERELGRGGMATVYLAQDVRHDRPVALKVLHPELAATLGPERFQREIRLAARLQHPHILTVLDSGESAGRLWFTMPFIEGESLRDRLNREKQLPVDDALRIARESADALEYAHQHGIVHRDIKPENILLSADHALVADFGIARAIGADEHLTQTGLAIGTPAYMSPEQAAGDRALDARTDVYSLGVVLYEMLVGEPPFTGPTAQAIVSRRLTEAPRPLRSIRESVPEAVEHAVSVAFARTPADRFASAREVRRGAGRAGSDVIGTGHDIRSTQPGASRRTDRRRSRDEVAAARAADRRARSRIPPRRSVCCSAGCGSTARLGGRVGVRGQAARGPPLREPGRPGRRVLRRRRHRRGAGKADADCPASR